MPSLETVTARTPIRMSIANLRTGETQDVLANPNEIEVAIDVGWNELEVPGMSHTPLQFKNVSNASIPLEFYCSEFMHGRDTLDDHSRFLQSLCYPDYDANSVLEGAPPRVLLVWPNVLSMTVVFRSLSIRFTHFSVEDGHPIRFTASAKVSEIRDVRLSSADVRAQGLRRGSSSTVGSTPQSGPWTGGDGGTSSGGAGVA